MSQINSLAPIKIILEKRCIHFKIFIVYVRVKMEQTIKMSQ